MRVASVCEDGPRKDVVANFFGLEDVVKMEMQGHQFLGPGSQRSNTDRGMKYSEI